MEKSRNILKQYKSAHSPEQLYKAWISEEMVVAPITGIESEPTQGGAFVLYSESPQGEAIMRGEFLDLVPGQRIEYTWHWEGSDEHTTIVVTFKNGTNQTDIEVSHRGFLSQESMEMHDAGWDAYFEALDKMA